VIHIAETSLVFIFILSLLFHFAVLFKLIPYDIVWGGRLKSLKDMYRFEAVSILINAVMLWIALQQASVIPQVFSNKIMGILFWIMCALFALNTLGNLASKSKVERLVFTPLTLIMSVCCAIIAMS